MATTAVLRTLGTVVCGRRIIVPPIQRQYAWNVGNTASNPTGSQSSKLIEDLENFVEDYHLGRTKKYFLGNIIAVADEGAEIEGEDTEWQLLDGQQRLTSLSLLFKAFDYQLNTINSDRARALQSKVSAGWISLDQNRFPDVDHPFPIKHRRPVDQREFFDFLNNRIEFIGQETNMGRVAHAYRTHAEKFTSTQQIERFIETILDHVIVSVTITDNLDMGFQMFQTANARGLPLSSYDMFRAFVVKKIESDFNEQPNHVKRGLHHFLDRLERVFQSNAWGDSDSKKETNLKNFMTSYMSIRSGSKLRGSTIVSSMELEIKSIDEPVELSNYLLDMYDHVETWKKDIHPGRPEDRTSYNFRFLRRMHRMGVSIHRPAYLAIATKLAPGKAEWMLKVVEWAIIKQLLKHGQLAGNTELFASGFPPDLKRVWNGEFAHPDAFLKFRSKWLQDKVSGDLNVGHQPYDSDNHCAYAILHRLEQGQGLASCDPGRNARTTSMVQLAPLDLTGDPHNNLIGNLFLTLGGANNGLSHNRVQTHNDSDDMTVRIQTVLEYTSSGDHNLRPDLQNLDEKSNFQQFIHRRSTRIYTRLNELYTEFLDSDSP